MKGHWSSNLTNWSKITARKNVDCMSLRLIVDGSWSVLLSANVERFSVSFHGFQGLDKGNLD